MRDYSLECEDFSGTRIPAHYGFIYTNDKDAYFFRFTSKRLTLNNYNLNLLKNSQGELMSTRNLFIGEEDKYPKTYLSLEVLKMNKEDFFANARLIEDGYITNKGNRRYLNYEALKDCLQMICTLIKTSQYIIYERKGGINQRVSISVKEEISILDSFNRSFNEVL